MLTFAVLFIAVNLLVDIWMAFPAVLLSIVLVAVMGTGLHSVIIAIAVIDWTRFCRVVRAETMVQKRQDYVASAVTIGLGRLRILRHEILPNVLPLLVVLFTLEMGIAVIVEAILSYVNLSLASSACRTMRGQPEVMVGRVSGTKPVRVPFAARSSVAGPLRRQARPDAVEPMSGPALHGPHPAVDETLYDALTRCSSRRSARFAACPRPSLVVRHRMEE